MKKKPNEVNIHVVDELAAEDLLNAVVIQAAKDYIYGCCNDGSDAYRLKRSAKSFIKGPYFRYYTKVSGEELIETLDQIISDCDRDYKLVKANLKTCYAN